MFEHGFTPLYTIDIEIAKFCTSAKLVEQTSSLYHSLTIGSSSSSEIVIHSSLCQTFT